jgi:hypothetical protein
MGSAYESMAEFGCNRAETFDLQKMKAVLRQRLSGEAQPSFNTSRSDQRQ